MIHGMDSKVTRERERGWVIKKGAAPSISLAPGLRVGQCLMDIDNVGLYVLL